MGFFMIRVSDVLAQFKDSLDDMKEALGEERAEEVIGPARDRGTACHKAFYDFVYEGIRTVDDILIQPYLDSFIEWFEMSVEEVYSMESEYKNEKYGFLGHPDLICRLKGDKGWSIIDFKIVAQVQIKTKLQLAGYDLLFWEGFIQRHIVLNFTKCDRNGEKIVKRKSIEFTAERAKHKAYFLAALTLYRFFHPTSKAKWSDTEDAA